MKCIIAGGRQTLTLNTHTDPVSIVDSAVIASGFDITMVISGNQRTFFGGKPIGGVDYIGELWAESKGLDVKLYPADWNKYGKSAGPIRNRRMSVYADCLIAIWDGKSRGTRHMIDCMKINDKPVYIHTITN